MEKRDIRDLGKTITDNRELLTAIFNEFSTLGSEQPKLVDVTLKKEGDGSPLEPFKVYIMDRENDITVESIKEGASDTAKTVGTKIGLNIKKINSDVQVPVYLRIRIDLPSQDIVGKMIHQHLPKDSWIQSSTSKKQFIDFRLNEKRNLPETVQEICVNKFLKIKKIHFFLMREFADELIMSDPEPFGYRVLESDTWSNYFSDKQKLKLDHMFAYHWKVSPNQNKEESHVNSFTLSTKFSFQESSYGKIFVFFLIALILGAVGGVGGNYLTRWIDGTGNRVEPTEQAKPQSIDSEEETNKLEKKSGTEDN